MPELVLDLRGISVVRSGAWIVSDVDWRVAAGERWVIVGPNGAGKSTVLAIASTRLWPSRGSVAVLGEEIGEVDARVLRRRIGDASAALGEDLHGQLTAADVVVSAATGALAPWWDAYSDADRVRARELLDLMGVAGLADRTYATLSTGERQRVLLARTLMPDPDLLLLDEPAAGMNPEESLELVELIERIRATRNLAIILIEHHMDVVMNLCSRITVLNFGCVIAEGTPDEIQNDPAVLKAYLGEKA